MGMMDKALEIGASFDWITPLMALWRTQIARTHVQFAIDKDDILYAKIALDKKQIRMQSCAIVNGVCCFVVRNESARWAADLLQRSGVHLWNAEHVAKHAPRTKRKPKPTRRKRSPWAEIWR